MGLGVRVWVQDTDRVRVALGMREWVWEGGLREELRVGEALSLGVGDGVAETVTEDAEGERLGDGDLPERDV